MKVRVDRVMLAGQFIVAHPGIHEELAHYAPSAELLQDAVDRNLVDLPTGADGVDNLLGPQGPGGGPENLQQSQAHRSDSQALLG